MLRLDAYRHIDKEGSSVIGEIDIFIPSIGLYVRKIKECKKGERKWFNWPIYCMEGGGGAKIFIPYLEFDPKERNQTLFDALRIEVDKYLHAEKMREAQQEANRLNEGREESVKAVPDHYYDQMKENDRLNQQSNSHEGNSLFGVRGGRVTDIRWIEGVAQEANQEDEEIPF